MKKITVALTIFCVILCVVLTVLQVVFNRPMFSIIISSYNYGRYLPDTIESVLASGYSDYEIIVVNDGSTDNTQDIMEYYADIDKRIRLISQENQGLSIARNNAMKIAKGRYFWFVDADDFISPEALEKMAYAIQKSVVANNNQWPDILSFLVQSVDGAGNISDFNYYTGLPAEILKHTVDQYEGNKLPIWVLKNFPVTSGKQIYRADYLKEKDIIFPPRQVFEDDCFFYPTVLSGAKGIVIPEKLYFKRSHTTSIVSNRPKYYDSTVRLPILIYKRLKAQGVSEKIAREFFAWYAEGVYGKWSYNPKHIVDLEKLFQFITKQPSDEFWQKHQERLQDFIKQKKEQYGIKSE